MSVYENWACLQDVKLTFSSLRCVDVEDRDDLFDIVDEEPDTLCTPIGPWLRETSSSEFMGIEALRLLICLFLGNSMSWLGVDEEVDVVAKQVNDNIAFKYHLISW